MTSVLSCTENDLYAFPLPFVVYSWAKLGVKSIVFCPSGDNPKIQLAKKYCFGKAFFYEFDAEEKRIPTFSQVSRLFAASVVNDDTEVLITGDSDLAVFTDYYEQLNDGRVHVVGSDLTDTDQYPMCFIAMPTHTWRDIFGIDKTYQEHLEELINPIQGLDIRGEQWCFDQWYAKKKIKESGVEVIEHPRSNGITQFAQNRADRDGWYFDPYNIIDAHLPRPLTEQANLDKVIDLFLTKFPEDDFNWVDSFANEYKKLL